MNEFTWFDAAALAILLVGLPVEAYFTFKRFLRRVAEGEPNVRAGEYAKVIGLQWGLTAGLLIGWRMLGREFPSLGFGLSLEWPFWLGLGLTVAALVLIGMQNLQVARSDASARAAIAKQMEPLERLLPHTKLETQAFIAVSFTAGFCEEVLYRGYLLACLSVFLPSWLAAVAAVAAFGIAHAYQAQLTQGPGGIIKTGIVGGVCMGLYFLTGSLWCPMLLHAAIDLQAGYLAWLLYVKYPRDDAAEVQAALANKAAESNDQEPAAQSADMPPAEVPPEM